MRDTSLQRAGEPGETTTLTLDPALRFGSLQTVYDDGRSMLVATSNDAPEQVDALLSWLGENVQRWSSLDGTAVIATADRQPVVYGATQSEGRIERRWSSLSKLQTYLACRGGPAHHAHIQRGVRTWLKALLSSKQAMDQRSPGT